MTKTFQSKAALRCGTVLAGAAGALLLAGLTAGTARAVPAYSYSELHFDHFTLSGIVGAGGGLDTGVSNLSDSVLSTDQANYPTPQIFQAHSASGTLTTGVDVAESQAGPSAVPPNTFTQQLTAGSGTRGDGQITGAIAGGATSNMVSEGRLTLSQQTAGSQAGSSTTLTATFDVTSTRKIGLSFFASVNMFSTVGQTGDSASALTSATFSIQDLSLSGPNNYIKICDLVASACSSAGSLSNAQIDPSALNNNIATTTPGDPASFTSPSTFYSYSATLAPGTYRVVLGDSTQEILATAPEPMSLVMLGTGLLGLGMARRRRRG